MKRKISGIQVQNHEIIHKSWEEKNEKLVTLTLEKGKIWNLKIFINITRFLQEIATLPKEKMRDLGENFNFTRFLEPLYSLETFKYTFYSSLFGFSHCNKIISVKPKQIVGFYK